MPSICQWKVLTLFCFFPSMSIAQSMSAMEIAAVCGGVQSLSVSGNEAEISAEGRDFRIKGADGEVEIYEGGALLAKIEDFTQESYNECVLKLTEITRDQQRSSAVDVPIFQDYLSPTYSTEWGQEPLDANVKFANFLTESTEKIVYIDIILDYSYFDNENFLYAEICSDRDGWRAESVSENNKVAGKILSLPVKTLKSGLLVDYGNQKEFGSNILPVAYQELDANVVDSEVEGVCSDYFQIEEGGYYSEGSGGTGIIVDMFKGFYRVQRALAYNEQYFLLREVDVDPEYWAIVADVPSLQDKLNSQP